MLEDMDVEDKVVNVESEFVEEITKKFLIGITIAFVEA